MRRFVKTIGKIACSLAIVACSMIPCVAQAADKGIYFKAGELYYHTIAKNRVEVCGTTRNEGTLTIPSKVAYKGKSYTVTQIADHENYYQDTPITEERTDGTVVAVGAVGCRTFRYDRVDGKTIPNDMYWLGSADITKVVLPGTLTYIGEGAFGGCDELQSVVFASKYNKLVVGKDAFGGNALKSIRFPNGTIELKDRAAGATESIYIPASVKKIGIRVVNAKTKKVVIDSRNRYFKMKDGILYSANEKTLISASANVKKKVVLSNKISKIMPNAFAETSITSVKWNKKVKVVAKGTFYRCDKLTKVTNTNRIQKIEYGAFAQCYKLQSIGEVPNVTKIGRAAFWQDKKLTFCIPAKAVNVDVYAFAGGEEGNPDIQVTVAEGNPVYAVVDQFLVKTDGDDKILMMQIKDAAALTIPEGITEVAGAVGGDKCIQIIFPKTLKRQYGRARVKGGTIKYQTAEAPELGREFDLTNTSGKQPVTILVPKGAKETYTKAINNYLGKLERYDGMDYFDELHQIAEYE